MNGTYASLTEMKRSTSPIDARISFSASVRQGSGSCSRNRSSPCSVQTTGALSESRSGRARPMSSAKGRLIASNRGWSCSHRSIFITSLR